MEAVRQLAGVVFVLGLLGAVLWLLRGQGATAWRSGQSVVQQYGRLTLTPHHTLHVIRFGGRELLVAAHPQGCSVLADREDAGKGAAA